ncbi:translation initiation factor IF-2 [Carpediemonas membranifera]|uniref:Translation initiation factor IF-2 n=1 Tax=Carpediemonas membranifera TaxID=201153 RepID=A0A8J6AQL9_9EUKA|nr:translation initiation factor IF-2 [Carpediemonas membranifera]|eukprot:KAG9391213.1 translation initiation factor IF-2 [Carpediemonas membranifera]
MRSSLLWKAILFTFLFATVMCDDDDDSGDSGDGVGALISLFVVFVIYFLIAISPLLVVIAFILIVIVAEVVLFFCLIKAFKGTYSKQTLIPYGIICIMLSPFLANFGFILFAVGIILVLIGFYQKNGVKARALNPSYGYQPLGMAPQQFQQGQPQAPYPPMQAQPYAPPGAYQPSGQEPSGYQQCGAH